MFGYVRVYQPELKMREWEQYRGIYCSLCRTLGRRYGLPARLTLNYDLTVLAAFHMALTPGCGGFAKGRCALNPFKTCRYCGEEPALAYAADAAVLLAYYKIADNAADSGFFRRLLLRPVQGAAWLTARRVRKRNPALAGQMARYAASQAAVEREKAPSLDAAAAPTAVMMAALTCAGPEPADGEEREARARFGYCLGRWIYFIDAADDWEEDRRRGRFNPFPPAEDGSCPRERMRQALNASLAECLTAYHLLTRYRFDPILQNILQYGMPAAQQKALAPHTKGGTTHDRSL